MTESSKQFILFHKRSITDLAFHRDGDMLFAASKDCTASMISLKGEIIGSFEKHDGAVCTLAPDNNSLLTAGLDLKVFLWDIFTGKAVSQPEIDSVVRSIDFDQIAYFSTDDSMGRESFVGLYDPRTSNISKVHHSNVSTTRLFKYDNYVIFSTADGIISKIDLRTHGEVSSVKAHRSKITTLRPSACRSFFVSGSSDSTVKILDSDSLVVKKKFENDEPVNSACIFPTNDRLVVVGGIDARDVTTTRGKGTFDATMFDVVTQKRVGTYTTHFGTINSVDVHPGLNYYCSGGEDGAVCLVKLGSDFYNAPFTRFNM